MEEEDKKRMALEEVERIKAELTKKAMNGMANLALTFTKDP